MLQNHMKGILVYSPTRPMKGAPQPHAVDGKCLQFNLALPLQQDGIVNPCRARSPTITVNAGTGALPTGSEGGTDIVIMRVPDRCL